jgi:uncharacterized membrane protein
MLGIHANSVLDRVFTRAHAFRNRQMHRKLFEGDRSEFYSKLYHPGNDVRVLSGPFTGMRYLNTATFGPIAPKWLGTYEWEIQDWVSQCCNKGYENIVNVGSAEGYYSVGFAWRSPASRVLAFDINPFARREVRRLAALNGVADRVTVRTLFAGRQLHSFGPGKNLLVVDIEGAEMALLNPVIFPDLKRFDILVELHETSESDNCKRSEEILKERFGATHRIQQRLQTDRSEWQTARQDVWRDRLSEGEVTRATNEFRVYVQSWLWLEAQPYA